MQIREVDGLWEVAKELRIEQLFLVLHDLSSFAMSGAQKTQNSPQSLPPSEQLKLNSSRFLSIDERL
jgi:hypothetical protein